eukprot:388726-Prymnesium_polylepis.1
MRVLSVPLLTRRRTISKCPYSDASHSAVSPPCARERKATRVRGARARRACNLAIDYLVLGVREC